MLINSQKCFLCHNNGHKAKNCTVRPELIKKPKRNSSKQDEEFDKKSYNSKQDWPQTPIHAKNDYIEETLEDQNAYFSDFSES